jgi:hypothetical protein
MSRDIICGAFGLAIATAYYAAATGIQQSLLSDAVGADGIPKLLAISLGLFSALLLLRAALRRQTTRGGEAQEAATMRQHLRALGLVGLGFAYAAVAPYLGYPLALALLIGAAVVYFGLRPSPRLVLVSAAGAMILWVLFVKLLNVPMPVGIWPRLFG